jgi:hypothetical protein
MEDRFSKYFQLTFNLFFTFIGFIAALLLLMVGLKYIFRLLDYIPWFVYVYVIFIINVPAAFFTGVFTIYFKRTRLHPHAAARATSYTVFSIALICWIAAFFSDMVTFIKTGSREISNYYGYNIFLLVASVALIFMVGVMQALSTEKEKDWMEKRKGL